MAFQIVDDILDYKGDQTVVGKPIGGDLRQGLFTLPFLYYMEANKSDSDINELLSGDCHFEEAQVNQIVNRIAQSEAIELSFKEAKQFCTRANQCLQQLPDSHERAELEQITNYIVARDF